MQTNLQSYFLGITESLLQSLSQKPTQKEVFETFRNFVEIFRSLSDNPSKTLQGLWAELFLIVAKTLGNTVEQSIRIKYDYNLANSSIRFYRHQGISKIERLSIPDRVSEVKYKSELTDLPPIDPNTIESDGELFRAI